MAAACLGGFPAWISRLMLVEKAFLLVALTSGMSALARLDRRANAFGSVTRPGRHAAGLRRRLRRPTLSLRRLAERDRWLFVVAAALAVRIEVRDATWSLSHGFASRSLARSSESCSSSYCPDVSRCRPHISRCRLFRPFLFGILESSLACATFQIKESPTTAAGLQRLRGGERRGNQHSWFLLPTNALIGLSLSSRHDRDSTRLSFALSLPLRGERGPAVERVKS